MLLLNFCTYFIDFLSKLIFSCDIVPSNRYREGPDVTSSPSRGRSKPRPLRFVEAKNIPQSATSSPSRNPRKFAIENESQASRRTSITCRQEKSGSPKVTPSRTPGARQKHDVRMEEAGKETGGVPPNIRTCLESPKLSKVHSSSRDGYEMNKFACQMTSESNVNSDTEVLSCNMYWGKKPGKILSEHDLGSSKRTDRFDHLDRDYDSDNGNGAYDSPEVTIEMDGPLKSRSRARRFKRAGSFGNALDGSPMKKVETASKENLKEVLLNNSNCLSIVFILLVKFYCDVNTASIGGSMGTQ